jgi:hypothetical protein
MNWDVDRQTKWAAAILVTLIVSVLILAFYGYLSGAWE